MRRAVLAGIVLVTRSEQMGRSTVANWTLERSTR